jgi:hypothetical protein
VFQPYRGRSENVSEYRATRDRYGQYASPTLAEILWTLQGKKDSHRSHEEADEAENIACASGEESLTGMSAVSCYGESTVAGNNNRCLEACASG